MSFVTNHNSRGFNAGWFLAHDETVERKTYQIKQEGATDDGNGGKYVPAGTVYPANGASAVGIVYEDVDVSGGDMPGSVVTRGTVYLDRLPVTPSSEAQTALKALGFVFVVNAPTVTRPE